MLKMEPTNDPCRAPAATLHAAAASTTNSTIYPLPRTRTWNNETRDRESEDRVATAAGSRFRFYRIRPLHTCVLTACVSRCACEMCALRCVSVAGAPWPWPRSSAEPTLISAARRREMIRVTLFPSICAPLSRTPSSSTPYFTLRYITVPGPRRGARIRL